MKRPVGEHASGSPEEGWDVSTTRLNDVLPLIRSDLTIREVAERLGVSVEAACTLVVAALRSRREEERRAKGETVLLREAGFKPVVQDGSLWEKDGICYGRQAASQEARRVLSEGDEDH